MTQPFGGMELLGRLSAGGMGEVLLARRRGAHGFEKLIAVKTIRGDLVRREDIRRMFLDEARLMARLDHPAIAQVYDFGEENDILYLAMEYVPGIVLSKMMKTRMSGLPAPVAARIAIEVCRGLHAAHELSDGDGKPLGVVHRDVSPHNLMVTFDGKVKILDFGIALRKGREAPETELGVVKGKATYVAPEQLSQGKVDRRSDIYSVAVVLHEMLTAKKLFSGTGNPVVDAEERKNIPPPSKIVPSSPPALDTIVMKGLEIDPGKRYLNAREMALALERCVELIGGETVEEFASRELALEKASHRARLSTITNGKEKEGTAPTAPARAPSGKSVSPIDVASADIMPVEVPISISAALPIGTPVSYPGSGGSGGSSGPKVAPPTVEERSPQTRSLTERAPSKEELAPTPPARGGRVLVALMGAAAVAALLAIGAQSERPLSGQQIAEAKQTAEDLKRALDTIVAPPAPEVEDPPAPAVAEQPVEPVKVAETIVPTATVAAAIIEPPAVVVVPTTTITETPETPAKLAEIQQPATTTITEQESSPSEDEVAQTEETVEDTPPIPPAVVASKSKTKIASKQRRQPAPQRFGYVTFEAEPNAVVIIDGKTAGYTPIRNLRLPVGKHEVQLRKPYTRVLRTRRTVWVQENKRVKITSVEKKK